MELHSSLNTMSIVISVNPLHRANLLTLMRICLAPFLVAAILEIRFALSFGTLCGGGAYGCAGWHCWHGCLKQRTMLGQYLIRLRTSSC